MTHKPDVYRMLLPRQEVKQGEAEEEVRFWLHGLSSLIGYLEAYSRKLHLACLKPYIFSQNPLNPPIHLDYLIY